jgi:hypothetical protein
MSPCFCVAIWAVNVAQQNKHTHVVNKIALNHSNETEFSLTCSCAALWAVTQCHTAHSSQPNKLFLHNADIQLQKANFTCSCAAFGAVAQCHTAHSPQPARHVTSRHTAAAAAASCLLQSPLQIVHWHVWPQLDAHCSSRRSSGSSSSSSGKAGGIGKPPQFRLATWLWLQYTSQESRQK